uniref:Odorant binding protein 9 n=1 Tax=Sogatella furcifera TaxID=113103 RepID=A0A096W1H8_SOGFU|nr:odorant binding protein 9 [Sogatella furcifera]
MNTFQKFILSGMVVLAGAMLITAEDTTIKIKNQQSPHKQQQVYCQAPPTAPERLERIIEQCQDDIKTALLQEALNVLTDTSPRDLVKKTRSKREVFSGEEKRIAGCLLQCVYRKVKAVNDQGMPTVPGLVRLYSEGVQDRNYYVATVQAVQQCVSASQHFRYYNPQVLKEDGYTCDLAYDMFNCVSDKIEAFCGRTP